VVGLGGMAGSVGGMLFAATAGYLLEWTGSYMTLFYIAASSYLIALAVIQLLVPKIKPLESF
jgi:ACS family hexuronate transporter-like MFS transporter